MQEWEIRKVIHWTVADCGLHPLIHTLLEFNPAQYVVICQCVEKEAPTDQSSKGQ